MELKVGDIDRVRSIEPAWVIVQESIKRHVVKILTDEPKRDTIAPSETDLYPPWRET